MRRKLVRLVVSRLLLIICLLLLLTGFGITEPGIISPLTLGIFGKAFSYRIHTILWGPFLILLVLHIYTSALKRKP